MKTYLVIGATGQHDSYFEWNVISALDRISADIFKDKLNKYLIDNKIPRNSSEECDLYEENDAVLKNAPDTQLNTNWFNYGIAYRVEAVQLIEN